MRSAKISIIMPVYNCERFLDNTLSMLTEQSFSDFELIAIDDGSTDSSLTILKQWELNDPRIVVFSQKNQGAGAARNKGLSEAKGDYLLFLDSDDLFEPNLLERAFSTAIESNADIVIYGADFYYEDSATFKQVPWLSLDRLPNKEVFDFLEINYPNRFRSTNGWTWDKLFKHSFVIKQDIRFQSLRTYNDMLFTYSLLALAERISVCHEILIHQRKNHKTSLSQTSHKSWWCVYEAVTELRKTLIDRGLYSQLEKDFNNYIVHIFEFTLNSVLYTEQITDLYPAMKSWLATLQPPLDDKYYYNENEYRWFRRFSDSNCEDYLARELILEHNRYLNSEAELHKERTKRTTAVNDVKRSNSYRIGRAVTYLPRLIKRLAKS